MSTTNNKYILGGIFVVIIALSAYFIFSKKSTTDNGGGGGAPGQNCSYGRDSNGNCIIPPDKCGDIPKPPANYCDPDQQLICDPKTQEWRCKSSCETKDNPFPYDFSFCETNNVKCDTNGKYYCKSNYCKNGGVLYSNANGICSCPPGFSGDKCQYDSRKCKGGELDPKTGKCISCCDSTTSYTYTGKDGQTKICNYYGDNCDQKCDDNYAYDPNTGVCVCPNCFLEKDSKCSQLSDCCKNGNIQNGKCVCSNGWTGVNCDIPICGQYGTWNSTTKKCDCLKDSNGISIAAGDRCQYTQDMCNGNGFPVTFNGVPSCVCDSKFSGAHCKCDNTQRPKQGEDPCRGISPYCTDNGWDMKYLECDDIPKQSLYGTEQIWQKKCTNYLTGQTYPDYKVKCRRKNNPDKDGINDFFAGAATCNAAPTDDMLAECRQYNKDNNNQCYIPSDHPNSGSDKISDFFTSVCTCQQSSSSDGGVSYQCQPVTNTDQCGPYPPSGFCSNGNPRCVNCGNSYIWACNQSVLPKDCAKSVWKLNPNPIDNSDKVWYNTTTEIKPNTVFPTINMDRCNTGLTPYNDLSDKIEYQPGYKNLGSAKGFVTKIGTSDQKFYDIDDKNIIVYNINANIDKDNNKISFIDSNNKYPFPDVDWSEMHDQNTGCAKLKNFDPNQEENTKCATDSQGNPNGNFIQYCADSNYNIVDCGSNSAFYKTDKGYCKCNKYTSNAQPQNDSVEYKGRYCQYNDNDNCSGQGIVDDKGKCNCISYKSQIQNAYVQYVGDNCQYSDDNYCKGLGIVFYNEYLYNPGCDFHILEDTSKYSPVNDPISSLKRDDIVIISYIVGVLDPYSRKLVNTINTGKFISNNCTNVDFSSSNICVFRVVILGENYLQFQLLNRITGDPDKLYDPSLYMHTDSNNTTSSIEIINPNFYYSLKNIGDSNNSLKISMTDNTVSSLDCDHNTNKLITNTDPNTISLWNIYKLNNNS